MALFSIQTVAGSGNYRIETPLPNMWFKNSLVAWVLELKINHNNNSVIQVVLGSIPSGDQILIILYYLKKPVKEKEYI